VSPLNRNDQGRSWRIENMSRPMLPGAVFPAARCHIASNSTIIGNAVSTKWKYQIRVYLSEELAEAARFDPGSQKLKLLLDVLAKHRARLMCQFDQFAAYVAEAERNGTEDYHLYEWTKATIEDPLKKAKYVEAFSLYVDGEEVYSKEIADALELDLMPLVHSAQIKKLSKHDSNPVNNPQPPSRAQE
jgi:hypothetical protein